MAARKLRPYQVDAVEAIRGAWHGGINRPAIVLPTGTGKTDVISQIATDAARDGKRILALAHRSELLDQITARCKMHAPEVGVGRVQAGRNEGRRPITVAMAQTLASDKRRGRLQPPELIIVDECHHAASPSYMDILSWGGSFDATPTMGVTATMTRGDKRGLGDVWQKVVYHKDIKWAVDQGWLVQPKGRAVVVSHMNLNQAKVSRGDYQDSELGEMVEQDVDQIVKAWLTHASDRITVAFTPNVSSAEALAAEFRAAGVETGEVYGHTPHTERKGIYEGLEAGEIQVLVSVMVTTEGWDCPPVSCILMARPTRLPGLYQQIVGRGLRPADNKRDCLVLDVVGASRFQRLVTLIDLDPTAEYDTEELDTLPCEDCGGAPRGQRLTEEAPYQCTCETVGDNEPLRIRLQGPAEYDDVEMFAVSTLNWLFTHGGVRFLPCGDRLAIIYPDGEDFLAGHCTVRGYDEGVYVGRDGHWHPDGPMSLGKARELAESWALAYDPGLAMKKSSWRRAGALPSVKQIQYARNLGVRDPETMNKARLSDEISICLASGVLD